MPTKNDFVVVDTNVLITARENRDYRKACSKLLEEIISQSQQKKVIVPQFVEFEFLKRSAEMREYADTIAYFEDKFIRLSVPPPVTITAHKILMLYKWNETTCDHAMNNKTLFIDLCTASVAIHFEKLFKKKTYILSSDQDFCPPYFSIKEAYKLDHANGFKCLYFYLYDANKAAILDDWKKYLDDLKRHKARLAKN